MTHQSDSLALLEARIRAYYRFHHRFYDATRWSFLFGRDLLLTRVHRLHSSPSHITEFGCGTGRNLLRLSKLFPHCSLTGIDLSAEMLEIARVRTRHLGSRLLLQQTTDFSSLRSPQDLILFSYCLSMVNPGSKALIDSALTCLSPSGLLCVVDFDSTSVTAYRRFMSANHVSLSGDLLPYLQRSTRPLHCQSLPAYLGLWKYFVFVGAPPFNQLPTSRLY